MFCSILESSAVCWIILAFSGACRDVLEYSGMFCQLEHLASSGACLCVLLHSGIFWCLWVCSGMWRYMRDILVPDPVPCHLHLSICPHDDDTRWLRGSCHASETLAFWLFGGSEMVVQPAEKSLMESVQPFLASLLEELMDPISSGFSQVRDLFEREVDELSRSFQSSSDGAQLQEVCGHWT